MVFDTRPYRLAIKEYLADNSLAPAKGLTLNLSLPLGIVARAALGRVTGNMAAKNNLALGSESPLPFPGVTKRTYLLTEPVRRALCPPPKAPTAPLHGGGYSALTDTTYAGPDQGVDFTGKGNVYALADGVVTRIDLNSGWPGGTIIVYKMLSGSRKGQYVYAAEALKPVASLRVGSLLKQGQLIAVLDSGFPGMEVGFAQDAHGTAFGTTQDGKPGGPAPIHGQEMADFIKQLSQ